MPKATLMMCFAIMGISSSLFAGTASAQAVPVTTGTVMGTVTNAAGGAPLDGICVNVVDAASNQTVGTSLPTGSSGVWRLKGVAPSTTYTATAFGCRNSNFVSQWYDGQDYQFQATQFTVTAGRSTTNIDFALDEGGSISGVVTDSSSKAPVAGMLVVAYWTSAQQVSTFAVCTTSTGSYRLKGVPVSGAKVEFLPNDCGTSSGYPDSWYRRQTSYATATVVPVTAGATTTRINQSVTATGTT